MFHLYWFGLATDTKLSKFCSICFFQRSFFLCHSGFFVCCLTPAIMSIPLNRTPHQLNRWFITLQYDSVMVFPFASVRYAYRVRHFYEYLAWDSFCWCENRLISLPCMLPNWANWVFFFPAVLTNRRYKRSWAMCLTVSNRMFATLPGWLLCQHILCIYIKI